MSEIDNVLMHNKLYKCSECGGQTVYTYSGIYQCENCGHEEKDDFAKVKEYIQQNGPTPAVIISKATGVKVNVIDEFLKTGRVEIPEGSPVYIKCEKCHTDIRYGRFCPDCARNMAGDLRKVFFNEHVGEKPKQVEGKMRFFDGK